mmetsp:Transcript_10351/g.18752  ORF Transcript_10351/g.18752 Transcript_10351/m.18752 type:complete len:552 (-) Transcript_10351:1279-2934(-)
MKQHIAEAVHATVFHGGRFWAVRVAAVRGQSNVGAVWHRRPRATQLSRHRFAHLIVGVLLGQLQPEALLLGALQRFKNHDLTVAHVVQEGFDSRVRQRGLRLGRHRLLKADDVAVLQLSVAEGGVGGDALTHDRRVVLDLLIHQQRCVHRPPRQLTHRLVQRVYAVVLVRKAAPHVRQFLLLRLVQLEKDQDLVLVQFCQLPVGLQRLQEQLHIRCCLLDRRVVFDVQHAQLLVLWQHRPVGTEGVVLPLCPEPVPLFLWRHTQLLRCLFLEVCESDGFRYTNALHLVVINKVKKYFAANLLLDVLLTRNLHVRVQVCLLFLLTFLFLLQQLSLQADAQRLGNVCLRNAALNAVPVLHPDVNQHIRVGVLRHLKGEVVVESARCGVVVLAKLFVQRALVVLLRDTLIFKPVPLLATGPDECVVVATVHAAAMDQHTVQSVAVANLPVRIWTEVLSVPNVQVQLIRKLIAIIDLHHNVAHEVILKALQLKLQDGGEALEQHALPRILHAMPIRLVLVLVLQHLHSAVLVKAGIHILAPLHIQLQVHEALRAR